MPSENQIKPETPYKAETSGVSVAVVPMYISDQSFPEKLQFCHSYTIRIENHGSEIVQLLARHWIVESNGALFTEVKGEGVVGEQPVLRPGETYTYTSGTMIPDPLGAMHGSYLFQHISGNEFQVKIPRFDLVAPSVLQ